MVHTPISGYRELSDDEIKLINQLKEMEERTLRVFETVAIGSVDLRWVAIAKTHIQEGYMAINRAIAQPARVKLPEDDTKIYEVADEATKESTSENIAPSSQ